ncbi:uncharacterized protein C9orf85 homolog [Actinia tenebrosa]|uniref:Uncharacterized protein C9orf85 homolog n=1 Tax=Actinia tenebrosa TaxID=6105 RepID=A0A6P8IA22_ACTTE|nr:uncharacterized protein C9orf85 homolog [Actinia tenebrosa]
MRKNIHAHIIDLSLRSCVQQFLENFRFLPKNVKFFSLIFSLRLTRMSSRKGDCKKKPQKYQNAIAFKNDLHDTSKTTKLINSTPVVGVCTRCRDAIEWRKKFKKYKPLKAPKKCVKCEQKTIKQAYHIYCTKCAQQGGFCEKCGEVKEILAQPEPSQQERAAQDSQLQQELKMLTERQRRTFFRHIEKGEPQDLTAIGGSLGSYEDEYDSEDEHDCLDDLTDLGQAGLKENVDS